MGRSPRVEYEGAIYHLMSRGNRQEPVFLDDLDSRMFLELLEEACGRTGWRVHAYVLMGNHYHLLIETPEANLVDGMRWLQGIYTKRFNMRHKQWGHLFQSRYKALLVDPSGDYFQTVSDYIHLNPARANCFDLENGKLTDYVWSSYSSYLRPVKRPAWLCVDRTLGALGFSDDRSGLRKYRQYMQKRVLEILCSDKPWAVDERWAKIRRGWCFGEEAFRNQMIKALDGVMEGNRRDSFVGDEMKRHDMLEAERLLRRGLAQLKLSFSELETLKKCDPRKKVMAWLVRKNTSVKNEWISEKVCMGCASKMSLYVREVAESKTGILYDLREMVKR